MKRVIAVVPFLWLAAVPALAATITNKDSEERLLVIVEGGNRVEVALEPGETEEVCERGCFVTLPSGDRIGLDGGENIEIQNGSATVK
ncbi:hypothetical protein [Sinorhizobium sp. BG8]|uniref:hypothetical protein n=1 Tax=Sinorhizobium sp. BG8 TaxID=2613773 RepID=UPI00193DCEF5|nr:hypothetical protein [Sinorhizobium sp. BG8]QRM55817.1 hypothetical protein F3Y30_15735 [Sinorhizobium sp. BG8]